MDSIANMLVSIKNGFMNRSEKILILSSKIIIEIAKILKKEGYIEDYQLTEDKKKLEIILKYQNNEPLVSQIQRISKPGCRVYAKNKEIPTVLGGLGMVIVSTPQGLMTGKQAKTKGLGGELICKIW